LKIAADLNDKDPHAQYGVTKFMDLSPEEFKEYYLMKNFSSPRMEGLKVSYFPSTNVKDDIPSTFDWNSRGAVTGVYNQGQCGFLLGVQCNRKCRVYGCYCRTWITFSFNATIS